MAYFKLPADLYESSNFELVGHLKSKGFVPVANTDNSFTHTLFGDTLVFNYHGVEPNISSPTVFLNAHACSIEICNAIATFNSMKANIEKQDEEISRLTEIVASYQKRGKHV